jgi:zinc protease
MLRFAPLLLAACLAAADSAVVVSRATRADPAWSGVVEALVKAHGSRVVELESAEAELRAAPPARVAWVARPEELGAEAVRRFHALARGLDADPYPDFRWGLVTGRTADDARRLVAPAPLVIRKVGASTAFAAECVEEGWWFDEFTAGERWAKARGGEAVRSDGAKDSTADIARLLSEGRADLWITSGHATEHNWEPGYRYRNGVFVHGDGVVTGKALDGSRHPVRNDRPMLYLAVGNCLIGNVPGKPDCMALAYLASAGVRGMLGYTEPTWFGYAGWGVLDYFLEQPGRFAANEAWHANLIALEWRLGEVRAGRVPAGEARGLQFDRDVTVYLGDPAWEARMAPGTLRWRETVAETAPGELTWTLEPLAGARTFAPVNTNGSQRGGRPPVLPLPRHAAGWEVLPGSAPGAVAGDDFALLPNPGPDAPVPERITVRLRRR